MGVIQGTIVNEHSKKEKEIETEKRWSEMTENARLLESEESR
jgi:hypothetical protein